MPASGPLATVVAFALAQLGKPYVKGAAGPRAFDCSGLVLGAWARAGVRLPHNAAAIAGYGRHLPLAQAQPGDVIEWGYHVAIYLGSGLVVTAPYPGASVRVERIWGHPYAVRIG